MREQDRLLSTLGLCARARALVVGTPLLCEAMHAGDGRILCVLEAADTSANTHKRLTDKCAYYRVPLHRLETDADALGRAVGKTGAVAAVGLTDAGLLRALHLPDVGAAGGENQPK